MSTTIAAVVALTLAAFGVVRGTWAVGGSDSSCYALMAQAFAAGDLQPVSRLAIDAPWPNAALTLASGGFIPSPVRPDAASPICAPGYSLLMAPLAAVFGRDAIFWLTPIGGAMLVWAAFAIARRLAGGMAGVTAALLTATSPIVLFQVVQPMNDVLTAALWLTALAILITDDDRDGLLRTWLAGICVGLAILVRPNLVPLSLPLAAILLVREATRGRRSRSIGALLAGILLAGVIPVLWLNRALFGGLMSSGYGNLSQLFSTSHIHDNLANFARALFDTQHLVPAIGLLAPVIFIGEKRMLSLVLTAAAAIVTGIYLLYRPFPEWWYLRFLMPALVIMLVLASAAAVEAASRARMGGVIPLAAVLIAILGTRAAGDRQAFELQRMEGRYRQTASLVAERLPDNAVLITVWQSGSVRFHAQREAVLWDSLDPAWLDRAVAWLGERGLKPYFLFERREEAEFRQRFRGHSELGALDWPPRFDLDRQVRIFDPADRARYRAGETYTTDNIRRRPRP